MKNIKKVAYIFTFFVISSNLCFSGSPSLREQRGFVYLGNDQRSIVQSFKDADNDEKAAWALTGVSALGVIFAAIGYKFYDSTKQTKPLENFIVMKSPGKDGKLVEKIITVYEKASDLPKSDLPKNNKNKVEVGDVVFVKGEVELQNKKKDGFKNGKFLNCVNKVSGKNAEDPKLLVWGEVAELFGLPVAPVVADGAPVVTEELTLDWSADGAPVFPAAPVVVVDPAPVADPVEGSVIVPPAPADAPADGAEEEDDADDSAVDPVVVVTPVPTDLAPAAASTGSPKDGSPIKKRSIKCKILGFVVATLSVAITIGALSAPYFMPPLSARHIDDSYKPNLHIGMPPCWPDQEPGYAIPWSPCDSVYSRRHPEERCWRPEDRTPPHLRDDGHYRSIHSSAY